jgi:hypothetical protein
MSRTSSKILSSAEAQASKQAAKEAIKDKKIQVKAAKEDHKRSLINVKATSRALVKIQKELAKLQK